MIINALKKSLNTLYLAEAGPIDTKHFAMDNKIVFLFDTTKIDIIYQKILRPLALPMKRSVVLMRQKFTFFSRELNDKIYDRT